MPNSLIDKDFGEQTAHTGEKACLQQLSAKITVSCQPNMKSAQVVLAERFSKALTKSEFDEAHAMLTRAAKQAISASELRRRYKEMTDDGGPVTRVEAMQDTSTWPGKERDDVAWVYVAISGNSFAEAVSVVVAREDGQELIRSVEWGRP